MKARKLALYSQGAATEHTRVPEEMQWYGSVGPAGMSPDVVKRLNETQVAVLNTRDLREKLAGEAVEPWPMSPEQFGDYIRAEIAGWTALAMARNIQLED